MPVDAIVAPLLRVGLFQGLKPLQITEIARQAERIVFRTGETIATAGAAGDAAILIVGGPARRTDDDETIEPGSLVGEMAMLIEHDFGVTVVADGPVRALRITRAALHAQMLDDPELARHLMDRIASRLTAVAAELRRIDDLLGDETDTQAPVAWLSALSGHNDGARPQLTH